MSWIDIDSVCANAMTVIAGANNEDRLLFRQWVGLCMNRLGPNKDWVKVCELSVSGFAMRKPEDMVATIDLALYNSSDEELAFTFSPQGGDRIHVDRFSTNATSGEALDRIFISEDAYSFLISSNATSANYGLLRYFSMPVDRDGMPMVQEKDLMAYILFCRWMWSMRKNDNRSEIDQNYMMWNQECDRVKGRNKMPDMLAADHILRSWVTLIGAPKRPNF